MKRRTTFITAAAALTILSACGEAPMEPTVLDAAAETVQLDLDLTTASLVTEVVVVDARLVGNPGGYVLTTNALQAGVEYQITVEGNWSAWLPSWWSCQSPYPAVFLSPSVPDGTEAGMDAEWRYADAGNCNRADTPYQGISFSLDAGGSWFDPAPIDGTFNSAHTYEYTVTGTGQQAGFLIGDTNEDNHGIMKVTVTEVVVDTDGDGVPDDQDVEPNLNNNYYYVDWTSADPAGGTASGTITLPSGHTVGAELRVLNPDGTNGFFWSALTNGGTNYWAANSYAPYKSDYVLNAPPSSDIIRLTGGTNSSYIITFTEAVQDPAMAIHSLGGGSTWAKYDFDRPFQIVSQGAGHHGGDATRLKIEPGEQLHGREGNGTIRFIGSFSTFSWTAGWYEFWHGFTLAIRGVADPNADYDGDGIPDAADSCPLVANQGSDFDNDGIDDACDTYDDSNDDSDGDGLTNGEEFVIGTSPTNPDTDGDGYNDSIDGAPLDPTRWTTDADNDGIADDVDNCPAVANGNQTDTDGDGQGDACDPDDDNDGTPDDEDAFPLDASEQSDNDGDDIGDNADPDDDNDGYTDADENDNGTDPFDAGSTPPDNDGDGVSDMNDPDDDNDGVDDGDDAFPFDPDEWADTDGDGVGDNADEFDNSDLSATVAINGCNTGVTNQFVRAGVTMNDLIGAAAAAAANHGDFVGAVTQMANVWKDTGLISGREKGAITSCVAQTDVGKSNKGRRGR